MSITEYKQSQAAPLYPCNSGSKSSQLMIRSVPDEAIVAYHRSVRLKPHARINVTPTALNFSPHLANLESAHSSQNNRYCRQINLAPATVTMLRWGILGTSFISDVVAKAVIASPGSHIQGVFGRDAGRLTAFADRYGIANRYGTMDELLCDPSIDVVYVGLPSHKHSEAVIAAAAKGKAILSEKSLATTMADANAMMAAVKESGVFFLEGLMYLCHPLMQTVVDIVNQKTKLGAIRGVSGYYAANIAKKANPHGMGTIYNLGCYPVSLLHLIMETAYGSDAWNSRIVLGNGTLAHDDGVPHARDAALSVRFDVGVLATIQSTDSFGNDFSFTVQGEKAVLTFKTNPWLPLAGDNVITIKTYGGDTETITVPSKLDAFGCQVKRVEDCVGAGLKQAPRPSPSWDNSLEIMGLLTEWEADIMKRNGQ